MIFYFKSSHSSVLNRESHSSSNFFYESFIFYLHLNIIQDYDFLVLNQHSFKFKANCPSLKTLVYNTLCCLCIFTHLF